MPRRRVAALVLLSTALLVGLTARDGSSRAALADGGITVDTGYGGVNTGIFVPGSPGTRDPITQPVGGGGPAGTPGVTCGYALFAEPEPPLHDPSQFGAYYTRACSDGTVVVVFILNAGAPAGAAPAGTPVVTAEQLAREARDRLVLSRPVVHRSPVETNDYQGEPFTWVNLWTWFWTDAGTYQPLRQTVSAGPVSATVVATPVGLLFDPGDGGDAVRCPGPGRPWTDADSNAAPVSGCGYQYRHVSDLAVTSRLGILWRVTWTGTGGTGGTLPTMETITDAPLRVLQVQVVNR